MRTRFLAPLCAALSLAAPSTSTASTGSVVFSSTRTGDSEIWSRDASTGAVRRLTSSPGVDVGPAVSPDGRTIAFASNRSGVRRIWLMRHDGAQARPLTTGPGLERDPAFSPDGTTIAYVSDRTGSPQVFTIRTDGTALRQLTASAGDNAAPTYSPDGSRIAFVSTRSLGPDGEPASDIWLMGADGTGQVNVSARPGGEGAPAFTPDGLSLVYGRDVGGLWRQRLSDGALTQLTDGPRDDEPAFSPDGTQLVFSGVGPPNEDEDPPPLNFDLYRTAAAGGPAERLTTETARDVRPRWGVTPVGVPGEDCTGGPLAGRGATNAAAAHTALGAAFAEEACPGGPAVSFNDPALGPAGQGIGETGDLAGWRALGWTTGWNSGGLRHDTVRWAGVDLAPTPAVRADMEDGATGAGDDGRLRTIPIALGAVAMLVNLPDGCTVPLGAQYRPASDGTARMVADNVSWEGAWAAEVTLWGDLLPDIGGAGCAERPIRRVAAADADGAGATVKRWLNAIEPARGWSLLERSAAWPGDDAATTVIREPAAAGVPLRVAQTDGAVGFALLPSARAGGFMITPGGADGVYWVPLTNDSGQLVDPQASRDGYRFGDIARRGANCTRVTWQGIPSGDATAGDWSVVSAAATPQGYPLCLLTSALAWEDACDVYGSSATELARAQTLRDLLGFATDAGGQATLARADLAALPPSVAAIGLDGVRGLGWATPGGSCG